ncbi:MAG: hypothetical protein HY720_23445 [Planctomycetes bacterium]|nr:hypothetical protein [Planctomycetota bacterium]
MADPYIDPLETQIYGPYAREQMESVCRGLIAAFDGVLDFCKEEQARVDRLVADVLARQPRSPSPGGLDGTIDEARDILVRFHNYLLSLKGHPVDPATFFGKEAPSIIARRRPVKLEGALKHIIDELDPDSERNKTRRAAGGKGEASAGAKGRAGARENVEPELAFKGRSEWLAEFRDVYSRLSKYGDAARERKVEVVDSRPEVAAARETWLAVYTANKAVITGLLRHAGKLMLLPLIFDDLAEVHRVSGVSDAPPSGAGAPPSTVPA